MLYHVSRNGQNYGPYTLEDLQRYVAAGNVLPTDLAKSDEMPDWVPVSQVLGRLRCRTRPAPRISLRRRSSGRVSRAGAAVYPDPPNLALGAGAALRHLHLRPVHARSGTLCSAAWMRKRVQPNSNAIFFYVADAVARVSAGRSACTPRSPDGYQPECIGCGRTMPTIR